MPSLRKPWPRVAAVKLGALLHVSPGDNTGTDVGLGFVGGGVFTKAATSRVATSEVVGQTVFHATSKEGAALNILNGINPVNNGDTDPPKTGQSDPPVTVDTDPPVRA